MSIQDIIYKRRSIRQYQNKPVEKDKLEPLLRAAMAAPSAMNIKPWEFVVVTEPETMDEIRSSLMFGKHNAPAAIVVCGNTSFFKHPMASRFWVQDCSAATENILLAAVGLGLGTVWLGVHPIHNFSKRISNILHLPKNVKPLNVIYVGYPAEEKPPRTQYDPDRVHWEVYS
ncbi:MAG: nitroreductase family protein [Chloroflexota bacterium]|jgi:nitroreductase|nr:nitroreductase family protein [Chloroflexota bacterium]